jgi:hypothetical protein
MNEDYKDNEVHASAMPISCMMLTRIVLLPHALRPKHDHRRNPW